MTLAGINNKLKQRKDLKLLVGLDYGFTNDPTALITSFIDEQNKIIYVIDEYVERGLTNDKIADIIKYKGLSKSVIIADSAEQKSIEEIKRQGIPKIKASVKGKTAALAGPAGNRYNIVCLNILIYTKCHTADHKAETSLAKLLV